MAPIATSPGARSGERLAAGKWRGRASPPSARSIGDERVLEHRRRPRGSHRHCDAARRAAPPGPARSPSPASGTSTSSRSPNRCTSTIAADRRRRAPSRRAAQVRRAHFEPLEPEAAAHLGRRADLLDDARRASARRDGSARLRRGTASPRGSSCPRAARCGSASQNSRRETGSTPVVGSSSSSTRGSGTSAHASASFCFMPPLSLPGQPSAKRSMSNIFR